MIETCLCTKREDEQPAWADLNQTSSGTTTQRWRCFAGKRKNWSPVAFQGQFMLYGRVQKRLHWEQGLQAKWIVGWIVEAVKDLRRSLVQPSAPSRVSCVIRSGCSGFSSLENLQMQPAQPPWSTQFSAQLSSGWKSFSLHPVCASRFSLCLMSSHCALL